MGDVEHLTSRENLQNVNRWTEVYFFVGHTPDLADPADQEWETTGGTPYGPIYVPVSAMDLFEDDDNDAAYYAEQ